MVIVMVVCAVIQQARFRIYIQRQRAFILKIKTTQLIIIRRVRYWEILQIEILKYITIVLQILIMFMQFLNILKVLVKWHWIIYMTLDGRNQF